MKFKNALMTLRNILYGKELNLSNFRNITVKTFGNRRVNVVIATVRLKCLYMFCFVLVFLMILNSLIHKGK